MRNGCLFALAAVLLLPAAAGAVVTFGEVPAVQAPQVEVLFWPAIDLDVEEIWEQPVPCPLPDAPLTYVYFSGQLSAPDGQLRAWLTYTDPFGQTVATDWQILYAPTDTFAQELAACPSDLTLHVKNRHCDPQTISNAVLTVVAVPEPATLALLAFAGGTLVLRRRV